MLDIFSKCAKIYLFFIKVKKQNTAALGLRWLVFSFERIAL